VRAKHGAVKIVRLKEESNPRAGGMSILLPKRLVQVRIFMLVPARRTCSENKTECEPEIEIEKIMEGMQETRTVLAMAVTAHKNMLNQLADRDREIVKLRDTLEGMEVRASKAERHVVRLHSAAKERDTYRLVMAFAVISCVAICASNTLCPQHHDSIKQEAQVVPMMPINSAWKQLDGGIRATT